MRGFLKIFNIAIIISCLFVSFACAELDGTRYTDKTAGFEINGPSGWQADTKRRGKVIVFFKNDGITEISVEVMPLEGTQKDSRDVAKDQNIAYDGWQYIAGRAMDWYEKHGADNGFSAMYNKIMLQQLSSNTRIIVQEGYFVKNRQTYIVTLVTNTSRWPDVKSELLSAWDSFKIY